MEWYIYATADSTLGNPWPLNVEKLKAVFGVAEDVSSVAKDARSVAIGRKPQVQWSQTSKTTCWIKHGPVQGKLVWRMNIDRVMQGHAGWVLRSAALLCAVRNTESGSSLDSGENRRLETTRERQSGAQWHIGPDKDGKLVLLPYVLEGNHFTFPWRSVMRVYLNVGSDAPKPSIFNSQDGGASAEFEGYVHAMGPKLNELFFIHPSIGNDPALNWGAQGQDGANKEVGASYGVNVGRRPRRQENVVSRRGTKHVRTAQALHE
ncbi:uncharacterized protein EI90DRAFT_3285652 [Cantharellus anzutake]|uniref:uncharacterized protein n=1 Tax=Cantharellus anzutake TaxID=1750568 RepID=UPI00190721B4|nr:uncharacterized protein EI90DRAFT_3285652 [Cantharellus anzutake]KAF8341560.1 hypothetical protein EI90DRAFT_3285652 [Cantharellus anzutake]